MNGTRRTPWSKRHAGKVALAVSFFLVFLGMRVPDITRPHSPKPRPRAVIESPVKAGQPAGQKASATSVFEACQPPTAPGLPPLFRTSFLCKLESFSSILVQQHVARAPPLIPA
ncbi:hypothetical protein SAMN06269301_2382 [Geobacter sp. DSM 9736]|nr:hypothetical protein SAMN06269301_2382 [Geobacter sp. DSM 9736]